MTTAEPPVGAVLAWYADAARDLPWRDGSASPWAVLVSEVMLQQTPVARVEPVWRMWMRRWPGPANLAAAPTADVIRAWGRLGYPRRALRLQACARAIVEDHDGTVPAALDELRSLPGVGEYTAAAVAVFAHGRRNAVLDTNVRRVLARAVQGRAHPPPALTALERRTAEGLLPQDPPTAAVWSVAIMELGALVCTAKSPACEACPLQARCAWVAAGRPAHEGPPRRAQRFEGTDRQARGVLLGFLRDHPGWHDRSAVLRLWPTHPDAQSERALASLIADGLVVADPAGLGVCLPGTPGRHTPSASAGGYSVPAVWTGGASGSSAFGVEVNVSSPSSPVPGS